ncbi:tetratricopeptide repeat protein [Pseudochryseolinea flava]|uniref:Tetratricopeptide repeat protein n=1 Tax=Pseudochryseolinea flava TaxID=2059302 RepID=A0A364Y5Y2_9BACT|nr:hypothetical protein [Pseudochryseolinea flava]RAW02242.1 hypothetical protein DQQ10_06785 [Pseudochryseolinea flava]
MKIFDINGKANNQFKITDGDRLWVEENFRWLKDVFGYPNKLEQQVLLNEKFFPATFGSPIVDADDVVDDLCVLFGISRDTVNCEVTADLRSVQDVPHQVEGKSFVCEADLTPGAYRIFVSRGLLNSRDLLTYNLIYEFIRIRLTESDLEFDVGGDDTGLFIYLAGIYYGFGVLLAGNLLHPQVNTNHWEIKWNHGAVMPTSVMAFSLATYANLTGEDDPAWKDDLAPDFQKMFADAISYLREHPNNLYDPMEVKSNELFNEANDHFDNNELEAAIAALQKILFITNDDVMRADVFNNMGYYYMRKKNYAMGISNFRKALALGPEFGYANDNLGYALIVTGDLEEGKVYLDKAIASGNSDIAYTFRNLALYYQRKKAFDLAEEFFQKSFGQHSSVDLLEFHYAEFLLEQGDTAKARTYFMKSADKAEHEATDRLHELGWM